MTTTPLQAAYEAFRDAARNADELAQTARNAVADAKAAARTVYVAKTNAAWAVKEYATTQRLTDTDTDETIEAVREVSRQFVDLYQKISDAAYAELQVAYAAASDAQRAAWEVLQNAG